MTPLQIGNYFASVMELIFFLLSRINPSLFCEKMIPFRSLCNAEASYHRNIGTIFLLLAAARFHGALHINEKGAYRIALWSWIIELIIFVEEIFVTRQMTLQDGAGALGLQILFITWSTISYKGYLYPSDKKKA